jgi:hypothetical protein
MCSGGLANRALEVPSSDEYAAREHERELEARIS